MKNGSDVLAELVLARKATCDACGSELRRGTRARAAVDDACAGGFRVRCRACHDAGKRPDDLHAWAAPAVATTSAVELAPRLTPTQWLVVGAAAGAIAVATSRTLRRVLALSAVALKSAARGLVAKLRGERDAAPKVVRLAFEDLGPTYIKLGQLVASSQGLFPERYCQELQKCLDRVPPFGFGDVHRTLREAYGKDPSEVFASIDETPLASASIAQVHAATLKDGSEVVIKVQRPNIGALVEADLRVLRVAARGFELLPRGELANPVAIVEDFEACLGEELDFVREAANMDEFNRIMREHGHEDVAAPAVRHDLTTTRVLVMERFRGHRVDDVEKIRERNVDGEAKLLVGLRAWFRCMMFHGFFHGDVHAGNLMALDDGRIGFLDFGIVGRFTKERREQVTDYLMAFASGDFRRLADVMVAMGSVEGTIDRDALAEDLRKAYEPILSQSSAAVKYADLIPAVLRVAVKHRMRMPREFVLVTKQMLYFDRYAKLLAPRLNIFSDPRLVAAVTMDVMRAHQMYAPVRN